MIDETTWFRGGLTLVDAGRTGSDADEQNGESGTPGCAVGDESSGAVMDAIYARGDRLMAIFLAAHCVIAAVLACFYSTWLVAAAVSIPAVVLFAGSALLVPRSLMTRCLAGVALQMFCALHIYQMHGLPEMHFFFFTATTAMIVYQDYRCILPGVFLIIGQHILFAILTNTGENLYFFPEAYITFTKLVFHFGIALVQAVLCSYWAFLLHRETLRDANQRSELRKSRESLQAQLIRTKESEAALQMQTSELLLTQERLRADMEERRQLEVDLWQARRMESVGRLAGGVAHDFNNLLTAILGYSELAQAGLPPDNPVNRDIEHIRRAAVSAADVTSQLLAFASKSVIAPRLVNLNRLIQETTDTISDILGPRIRLVTDLAVDLEPVNVDPAQFERILLNIAMNSRDAMPDGGTLSVSTRSMTLQQSGSSELRDVPEGSYSVLEVRDTGVGMDREMLQHVFEPFFTTKPMGRGTGLGLATCYGIVTQARGLIRAASAPGEGTTFTILLPCVAAEQAVDRSVLCAA